MRLGLGLGLGLTRQSGGGFNPTSLFANGEGGGLWLSDPQYLRQASTGIGAVATPGDPVGLQFDCRLWGGKTFEQMLAGQAELVTNGGFDSATGWFAESGAAISGGVGIFAGGAAERLRQDVCIIGSWYEATFEVTEYTSGAPSVQFGSNIIGFTGSVGVKRVIGRCIGATVFAVRGPSAIYKIDNISVKEIPGNHGIQTTTAARPWFYPTPYRLLRPDASDDNLLTTALCGAAGNTIAAHIKVPASIAATRLVMGTMTAAAGRFWMGFNASGHLVGGVGDNFSDVVVHAVDYRGQTGTLALAEDGSNWRLYWNGAQVATGVRNGAPTTTIPIRLHALNQNGTAASFSNLDTSAMLHRAPHLSSAEILQLANHWNAS